MKDSLHGIGEDYASALADYLASGDEALLKRAYEMGREALARGGGVLEVAALHYEALAWIRASKPAQEDDSARRERVQAFFLDCLSPFEIAHRGFLETNAALRRINEALENEARRIAHALHDQAGPLLVAAHIAVENLRRDLPPEARGQLDGIREHLDRIEDQLRRLSHELRPTLLEHLGLGPAVRSLAEGISTRSGVRIEVLGFSEERLPPGVETALYRIIQEALTNVSRHARARRAEVRLARQPRKVLCSISDDGDGFESSQGSPMTGGGGGLGLIGIRERLGVLGGAMEIVSRPGRGTELKVTIPLEA